jgi:hypothetical protein
MQMLDALFIASNCLIASTATSDSRTISLWICDLNRLDIHNSDLPTITSFNAVCNGTVDEAGDTYKTITLHGLFILFTC